jgi:signal transduction histidine kinase
LRDERVPDVLETDLLLASRMRTLVHEQRMLAHDLRAPLNAMHLSLELLAATLSEEAPVAAGAAEPVTASWQRHVSVIREELDRLQRLMAAALEHKEPIGSARENFDLRSTASEVARLLGPQARKQQVDIKVNLAEAPAAVVGARESIKQALLNVAVNALEAMEDGACSLSVRGDDDRVIVAVEDTGRGIPGETIEEIYQLDWYARKTGTGLYVARRIIETHAGHIEVENVPGRGTRFVLALPAAPVA